MTPRSREEQRSNGLFFGKVADNEQDIGICNGLGGFKSSRGLKGKRVDGHLKLRCRERSAYCDIPTKTSGAMQERDSPGCLVSGRDGLKNSRKIVARRREDIDHPRKRGS